MGLKQSRVFIASSKEGLEVAKAIEALLKEKLGEKVEIRPWTRAFDLSATYIESLEKASEETDFAVLVMTPDDVVKSRAKKKQAPRDNVVFELGLFMGSLTRQRCFIVSEDAPELTRSTGLKLPTDLLGVHVANFRRSSDGNMITALDAPSSLIAEQISTLEPRFKLTRNLLTSYQTLRTFSARVEGVWWERITRDDPTTSMLSFFRIEPDPVFNSVACGGKSYNKAGAHVANWKSEIARVDEEEDKILYHWRGWATPGNRANTTFHGFGEMEFDDPGKPDDVFDRGGGKFWSVDEGHPENTLVKPFELRRVTDPSIISAMAVGNGSTIRGLVKETLREW